jgi:hypothetical protein
MVLDQATRDSDPFGSDSAPSSDIDPYSSHPSSSRDSTFVPVAGTGDNKVYVNTSNLPKPFGASSHPQVLVSAIQDSCRFAQQVLKRPATQEEADAFAYHAAKTFRIASYGVPIGGMLASVQFMRTMSTFRFPGWSPFKEGSARTAESFGPLKGQLARYAWHSSRLTAYLLLGTTLGQIFFGSYAVSVSLAGRVMDPRLKQFTERLKQMQREGADLQKIRRGSGQDGTTTTQNETFEMRRQRRAVQGMDRGGGQGSGSSAQQHDDMSPTGGAFGSEHETLSGDTGLTTDSQLDTQQSRLRAEYHARNANSGFNTAQAESYARNDERVDDTFDLSSTTQERSSTTQATPSTSSVQGTPPRPGSTWERLRQQAGQSNNQSPSPRQLSSRLQDEQRQGSTTGDSFSFSKSDEERQLAKFEAQKEFDARLDRERQGEDFGGQSGKERKW